MYQSAAKIRKQVRAAAEREIHQPTGLTYRVLHSILKSDFRYCVWWKGSSGSPFIWEISRCDRPDDVREMQLRASLLGQRPGKEVPQVGMVEVRLITPAKVRNHAKVQAWLKSPSPEF